MLLPPVIHSSLHPHLQPESGRPDRRVHHIDGESGSLQARLETDKRWHRAIGRGTNSTILQHIDSVLVRGHWPRRSVRWHARETQRGACGRDSPPPPIEMGRMDEAGLAGSVEDASWRRVADQIGRRVGHRGPDGKPIMGYICTCYVWSVRTYMHMHAGERTKHGHGA